MRTAIAACAALLALAAAVWFGVRGAADRQTIARLEAELARARQAAPLSPAAPAPASPPAGQNPAAAAPRAHDRFESTANPEADLLRARLAESRKTVDDLNARLRQLEAQAAQGADERARSASSAAQLQTRVDELTRTVQALSSERADLGRRVAELDAANAQLRAARADTDRRSAQFARLMTDLEDVGRRQQNYLANILRRYRDVTEQFRVLPAALDPGATGSGAEISRIQSALAMADEDLRQLNELNTRLVRVQKQLAAAASGK